MLQSLKIENFKRFKTLEFPTLKRVNLIAGKNNTGKTGVLEATLLLLEPSTFLERFGTAFRNLNNVGNSNENLWKWAFHNRDVTHAVRVSGKFSGDGELFYALTPAGAKVPEGYVTVVGTQAVVSAPASKPWRASTDGAAVLSLRPSDPTTDAADYDRVVLKPDGEQRLEALLRKIEPRLKTVRSINPHSARLIYVDVGLPEKIPAAHLGQGFIRLLSIYSEIIGSGKKVLLIDEFENGLHYSILTEVWRGILHATEQERIQVFATTHSYECIRAAHAAFAETLAYDFALHRLEEVKGEVTVTTYDKEALETSLSNGFEIR